MSNGLWRSHPATDPQRQLAFGSRSKKGGRATQADVLVALLRKAQADHRALDLPEIMQAGIAQFTARIFELRERGYVIENELRRSADGRVLSRYWLRHDPEQGERQ